MVEPEEKGKAAAVSLENLGRRERLNTAIIRYCIKHGNPELLRYTVPQFSLRSIAWFNSLFWGKSVPPNFNTPFKHIDGLEDGQLMWFCEAPDRKPEDPVLFILHGGGYVAAALPSHATYPKYIYDHVRNDRLSIAWLDYTLSSKAVYPAQLNEAALALNALSATSNNIILSGDSAGGHLALQVFRHIVYPVPGVVPIPESNRPQTLILNSPWVDLLGDKTLAQESSYDKFDGLDYLARRAIIVSAKMLVPDQTALNSGQLNPYHDREADWDKVLPDKSRVFISYGDKEVFLDSIVEFIKLARLREDGATVFEDPAGVHVSYLTCSPRWLGRPITEFLKSKL